MRSCRTVATLVLGLTASAVLAFEPSSTSPYTFVPPPSCSGCETLSHERVGDGFFHAPGCNQSGAPLYFCDCTIGYVSTEMLQQPILRVVQGTNNVELEYWAKNAYCNPPPGGGDIHVPNSIPFKIQVFQLDPVTFVPSANAVHIVPPYWEHGKVTFTDLNPACNLYRAIYIVTDLNFVDRFVSSDVIGATANSGGASCLVDLGSCPITAAPGAPSSGVSPGVGKPINVGSGNMHYGEPLFTISGPGNASLSFTVSYNSRDTSAGWLGVGFIHTFDQRLENISGSSAKLWHGPDGLRVLWVSENHPPTGPIRRAVYPGDMTGTMTQPSTFQMKNLAGTVTEFNSTTGRWVQTTDKWGNAVAGSYDGSGNLTTITDALQRTWTLAYTSGKLTSITDADNNQWRFTYDGSGRLEKIFDPLHTGTTPWRQYTWVTYDVTKPAVLAKVVDDNGAVLEAHQYDAQGRALSSWSGDTTGDPPAPGPNARDLVTLSYDSATQTTATSKIDSGVNQATVYTLKVGSGRFLATSIVGTCVTCGQVEDALAYTFDDENHPLSKIVGTGTEQVETRYSYDSNGMLSSMTEAYGKPEQRVITSSHTKADWPEFVTQITETSAAHPPQSKTRTFAWSGTNDTMLAETISGYFDSSSSAVSYVTTSTYDTKHRLIQRDGPVANQRTTWSYYADNDSTLNRRGRLQNSVLSTTTTATLTTTFDDYDIYGSARKETDPNGVEMRKVLDARGRAAELRSVKPAGDSSEPADYVTTLVYDSRDRMTSIAFPLGNKTTYSYEDGTNRLLRMIRVDASGNERERVAHTLNTIGAKTTESFDECTMPAASCTAWTTRRSDSFTYSAAARLTTVTHPDATTLTYAYDTRGNLTLVKDERHTAANTIYSYDSLNRLKTVTQKQTIVAGSDVVTQYGYDVQDNLTSITDPNGNVTTYNYDDFHRIQKQVSPVTGTTTYSYDASGNLLTTVDANSATTTRTYDLANRITGSTSSRTGSPTETISWTYDSATTGAYGKGRLDTMTDLGGSTSFLYERRGLLRSENRTIAGISYTMTYGNDVNGNRSSVGYPSGRTVAYAFDFADRPLTASTSPTTFVSDATYYPFGPTKKITFGNGTAQELTFDTRYRPTANQITSGVTTIAGYSYTTDAAANIMSIHDTQDATWNRDFTYDDLNRLLTANSGSSLWGTGRFSYDAMGNILSSTLGGSTTTFSYSGTTPKLTSVTSGSTTTVTYDSAGNETQTDVTHTISPRNLVTQIDAQYVRYVLTYDGRGIRVVRSDVPKKFSDSWKTYHSIYSPELQLLSTTRYNVIWGAPVAPKTTEIVWFAGRPVAQIDITSGIPITSYTDTDHLGSPILQTNAVGSITWRAEYEPYGRIFTMRVSTADAQPLRLPGQDGAIGNEVYNIFRWYRSNWGRYTQSDPLSVQQPRIFLKQDRPHLFAYSAQDPIGLSDPTGLCTKCDTCPSGKWTVDPLGFGASAAVIGGITYQQTSYTCQDNGVSVKIKTTCALFGPILGAGLGVTGPGKACGCNVSDLLNPGKASQGWTGWLGPVNIDINKCTDFDPVATSGGLSKSWGAGFSKTWCWSEEKK